MLVPIIGEDVRTSNQNNSAYSLFAILMIMVGGKNPVVLSALAANLWTNTHTHTQMYTHINITAFRIVDIPFIAMVTNPFQDR